MGIIPTIIIISSIISGHCCSVRLLSCPSFEIFLPAFIADGLIPLLPFPQAGQWNTCVFTKGLLFHFQSATVGRNTLDLAIQVESGILINKIISRHTIVFCQPSGSLQWNMLRRPTLNIIVHAPIQASNRCHLSLHQPKMMSAPPQPVRNRCDFPIAVIGLVHHRGLQNLMWRVQSEVMDVEQHIPEAPFLRITVNIHVFRNLRHYIPIFAFLLNCHLFLFLKVLGDRVAFSTHLAA